MPDLRKFITSLLFDFDDSEKDAAEKVAAEKVAAEKNMLLSFVGPKITETQFFNNYIHDLNKGSFVYLLNNGQTQSLSDEELTTLFYQIIKNLLLPKHLLLTDKPSQSSSTMEVLREDNSLGVEEKSFFDSVASSFESFGAGVVDAFNSFIQLCIDAISELGKFLGIIDDTRYALKPEGNAHLNSYYVKASEEQSPEDDAPRKEPLRITWKS